MFHQHAGRRSTTTLLAALGLAASLSACKSDSNNAAPVVATSITAVAASNGQTAQVGTAISQPLQVTVVDQNGSPASGAVVTWTVVSGAGTVLTATSTAGPAGVATNGWILDTIARVDSVVAAIQSGTTVTLTATGTAGPAAKTNKLSGDAQTVVSGGNAAPFVVQVTDTFGNPVSGIVVLWAITGGNGALSAPSSTTDANGQAQVTLTLGATPGTYTVTGTPGSLAPATFTVTGI